MWGNKALIHRQHKKRSRDPYNSLHSLYYRGDSEKQDLLKFGKIARTAPPDAHDAQLSNGPIGASIRVREVPIQQCQRLTSRLGVRGLSLP